MGTHAKGNPPRESVGDTTPTLGDNAGFVPLDLSFISSEREPLPPSALRHNSENLILLLGILLTVGVFILGLIVVISLREFDEDFGAILVGLVLPLFAPLYFRYKQWGDIPNGVQLSEHQLPEIYACYLQLARDMGFGDGGRPIPRLYLMNGSGKLNAYGACKRRVGHIVLYNDTLDIAYETRDPGLIRFTLAHELGHIKCGHGDLWRLMILPVMKLTTLNRTQSRAQEYTADRVAARYRGEDAMSLLHMFAGKTRSRDLDVAEYYRMLDAHHSTFWLRLANFMSTSPLGFRRMRALRDAPTGKWDVHGRIL